MRIGIKYCGGCNPLYERKKIVKRLNADYENIVCEAIQENINYDLILVICGCRASCSKYEALERFKDVIFIYSLEDYNRVVEFIENRKEADGGL